MNNFNLADNPLGAHDDLTGTSSHSALDKLRIDTGLQLVADQVKTGTGADGAAPDMSLAKTLLKEQDREAAAAKIANDEVPAAQSHASNQIAYQRVLHESNSAYPDLPQFPDITHKQKEQLAAAIVQNNFKNFHGDPALAKELREADRQLERLRLGLKGTSPTPAEKVLLEQYGIVTKQE